MTEPPNRADIRAELERARLEFHDLVQHSTPEDLARASNGTRWTNRELLFHMLFGYLITRNLRYIVKTMSRSPRSVQHGFAVALNATTRAFHVINYLGSRVGGRVISPARMMRWCDRIIASLQGTLDADAGTRRSMAFPTRWDPYFNARMTLQDVYHYATLHFDHHRNQLTLRSW